MKAPPSDQWEDMWEYMDNGFEWPVPDQPWRPQYIHPETGRPIGIRRSRVQEE